MDHNGIGFLLGMTGKLTKYTQPGADIKRLRNNIVLIMKFFPKVESCPIDQTLLKKAMNQLKVAGYSFVIEGNDYGMRSPSGNVLLTKHIEMPGGHTVCVTEK